MTDPHPHGVIAILEHVDDELRRLTSEIDFNGAAEETELARAEKRLGYRFPSPYREFLLETDGGEGPVGEHGWVRFESLRELLQTNEDAHHERMLGLFDGLVVFAGNGAGEAYCFDADDRVWRAAWISSPDDHMLLGTFMEFVRAQDRDVWNPQSE